MSAMRAEDRLRTCPQCGATLDVVGSDDPTVTINASGGQPNVWIIEQTGREVHRCVVDDEEYFGATGRE
jgi:hypothetical protein